VALPDRADRNPDPDSPGLAPPLSWLPSATTPSSGKPLPALVGDTLAVVVLCTMMVKGNWQNQSLCPSNTTCTRILALLGWTTGAGRTPDTFPRPRSVSMLSFSHQSAGSQSFQSFSLGAEGLGELPSDQSPGRRVEVVKPGVGHPAEADHRSPCLLQEHHVPRTHPTIRCLPGRSEPRLDRLRPVEDVSEEGFDEHSQVQPARREWVSRFPQDVAPQVVAGDGQPDRVKVP
jgi:hypothetical protein